MTDAETKLVAGAYAEDGYIQPFRYILVNRGGLKDLFEAILPHMGRRMGRRIREVLRMMEETPYAHDRKRRRPPVMKLPHGPGERARTCSLASEAEMASVPGLLPSGRE